MRREIVIAGFGGQGIQRLGKTLAKALNAKGFLVSLKSNYGPAARGGGSFSQVVVKESLEPPRAHQYAIPATKVANELGSQIVANMVMFGAVAAVTGLFSLENLSGVIKKEAGKFSDLNLEAVKEGYKLGSMFKS